MGKVVDLVPNNRGIGFGANPWWNDVLANGRASEFAEFFDLEWDPLKPELRDKMLLPILSDQYGAELEAGHIRLVADDDGFQVEYNGTKLPLDPQTIPMIFEPGADELEDPASEEHRAERQELRNLLSRLRNLRSHRTTDAEQVRQRRRATPLLTETLRDLLRRSPWVKRLIERAVRLCNGRPGDPRGFDCLHRLLEAQAYRLANWRVSGEEINYRRFFDVNDLIGLRMENPRGFAATQQLLRRLLPDDMIQGVRIDHCDGLLNPRQYLMRLQMLYAASQCLGAAPKPPLAENGIKLEVQQIFGQHNWIKDRAPLCPVVEKILLPGEEMPPDWPVDGTSGYEFAALLHGVFIDSR